MKNSIIYVIFIFLVLSCRDSKNVIKDTLSTEKIIIDTIPSNLNKTIVKDTLKSIYDFKKVLNEIKEIKHAKDKHQDWMSNKARPLRHSFQLHWKYFKVETTSYSYKKDCIFYLHTLKHINDSISIKPFIENALGKQTEGYTQNRVLIFTMKNDKEANFIDIPEKLNPLKLRKELLNTLYKNIDSDIILCNKYKPCEYKDLRK